MLLFSHTITPRLRYIADFISAACFEEPLVLTSNLTEYRHYSDAKINYTNNEITHGEFRLSPHRILFETGVRPQHIECFTSREMKCFFKTAGDLDYDLFAATFYLLSRYEEYLPHRKDNYGRYSHENSLAFREGFLKIPLVNQWMEDFKNALKKKDSQFRLKHQQYAFLPTYDVDIAFSYRNKGTLRTFGGIIKSLAKGHWKSMSQRAKVLRGQKTDPFDAYDWMDALHERYALQAFYFFNVAGNTGKYDKNISPRNSAMKELITRHGRKYRLGIHPSWKSGDVPALIAREKKTLEHIAGQKIDSSRQHYLRFELPATFRHLIEAGITSDFSLGYGTINGFRASVASPFFWYDLEKEEQTKLRLFPFCFMDANSFFEQKQSPSEAIEELKSFESAVKAVNGQLITIWHNTFLGTDEMFSGWREAYETWLKSR